MNRWIVVMAGATSCLWLAGCGGCKTSPVVDASQGRKPDASREDAARRDAVHEDLRRADVWRPDAGDGDVGARDVGARDGGRLDATSVDREFTFDAWGPVDPPVEPPPPPGITHEGGTLFSMDTSVAEAEGALHGGPVGAALIARLASSSGMRRLVYRAGPGAPEQVLVRAGWNLPPVGRARADGGLLFCWNRLSGSSDAQAPMPHPSAGLRVECRYRDISGNLGVVLDATVDAVPTWLLDLTPGDADQIVLRLHRNQDGWLVGRPRPDDGIFTRTFDGQSLGAAVRVSP